MAKEVYNYKQVFDTPITIRRLYKDYTLPFSVSVSRIAIMVGTLLFLLLFRQAIAALNQVFSGASVLIYVFLPWLTSKYLMRVKPNGKKLHEFLWDFAPFVWSAYVTKETYCQHQAIRYIKTATIPKHDVYVRRKEICKSKRP